MEDTLTMEHISPYLPYGLRAKKVNHFKIPVSGAYIGNYGGLYLISHDGSYCVDKECRLMLRKMDLIKPIIIDDNEVIPIV